MGVKRPLNPLNPPPPPPQAVGAKRGLLIFRGQSYKIINKEIVLRSLTGFARKIDSKISLTGAPRYRCIPNPCRKINEVNVQ